MQYLDRSCDLFRRSVPTRRRRCSSTVSVLHGRTATRCAFPRFARGTFGAFDAHHVVSHTPPPSCSRRKRSGGRDQAGAIQLSVIIPTYNRSRLLRACLDALSRQTEPPQSFEVIVVVDGSTDDTRAMLADLATTSCPCRLR